MHLHLACLRPSHSHADGEGLEEGYDGDDSLTKLEGNESSVFGNAFILTTPVIMVCATWLYPSNEPLTLFGGVIRQIRRKRREEESINILNLKLESF